MKTVLTALICLLAWPLGGRADETRPEPAPVPVTEVLVSDALPLLLPAFHDADLAGVKIKDLFEAMPFSFGADAPRDGGAFPGPDGRDSAWRKAGSGEGIFGWAAPERPEVRYLAFSVDADRWRKVTMEVTTGRPVKAALDGEAVALTDKDGVSSGELTLTIGKHLVCLRTLGDPAAEGDWSVGLALKPAADAPAGAVAATIDPTRHVDIQDILDAPRISEVDLSPDGSLAAVSLGEYRDGKNREQWLEIRDTADGRLVSYWRGQGAPSSLQWHPTGTKLSWQTTQDGKGTIWLYDLPAGSAAPVLEGVDKLGSWRWAPDGRSIVYEINREPEADKRKVKRVAHPADRQSWYRNRSHLEQVFVPGGVSRRLTAGPVSPESWRISDDGGSLLFFTSEPDLTARPYSTSTLWMMDLATLATQQILDDRWVGGAEFSPDGKTLCLSGSPSAFAGSGRDLPEGVQANDYGGQLYLFDLATRTPDPITVDFRPDVDWFAWSRADGMIYARCTDTQYSTVYRFNPGKGGWERVDTGLEYTDAIALPRSGGVAMARGTDANRPNRIMRIDLKKNRSREWLAPAAGDYRDVALGKVETWAARLPKGEDLDGFIYYPPDFDPAKTYPVIVYYYGGTSPVTRDFGGRYPKNVWAGQGYVVYVPNPSGATGYGQEFAARHVNDWGKLTAGEVIEATKVFLDTFGWADRDHVGCIGASYGGFLTESIVTQTDIFAAAVSHAGISDISSYWGEGLWGYAYGARALANSFPWQDRELFVGQSPLFQADRITTPLLLVHGDSDTNVPKGESDQLFTALKLLGREVEYVQVMDQDHHILDHDQRIVWNDTILSFFAKHLKGQPEWWEAMYPEPKDWR